MARLLLHLYSVRRPVPRLLEKSANLSSLGMHMGLPALIESELDFTVVQDYLRQSTMPLSFTTCVRVQLVVSKFISLLNRDLGEAAGLSLIRLFDADLAALRPEGLHDEAQSRFIEFCVLDAKIHFYTLFITKTAYDSTSRAIMLRSAFSAALRIINLATSEWHGRPDAKHDEAFIQRQRSFSKGRYRCICLATVFLLKFFHNNSNSAAASQEERQLAANHICLAGEQFKACSINPADEYARIASLFEILARMKPDDDEANRLRLTHRMGVSIVLDAVSNANEIHNRRSESAAASASGTVPGHHHGHHGHHHHHSHLDDDEAPEHLVSTGETSPTDPVLQQQQQLQHDVFRQQQQFQDPFAMAGPDMMRELWTDPVLSMIDFDQAFYMGDFTA